MTAFRREWTSGECDITAARHQFIDWLEAPSVIDAAADPHVS
jgi:hypothetical protein